MLNIKQIRHYLQGTGFEFRLRPAELFACNKFCPLTNQTSTLTYVPCAQIINLSIINYQEHTYTKHITETKNLLGFFRSRVVGFKDKRLMLYSVIRRKPSHKLRVLHAWLIASTVLTQCLILNRGGCCNRML